MIYIIVLTMSGKVKKVNYRDVRGELSEIPLAHRGSEGVKIALSIRKAILVHPWSRVLLFTEDGYCSIINPDELRPMGFMAEGITGMRGKKVIDILEDPLTPMEIEAIEKGGFE
jgi:DNA gyrase/topoisomerase IV subunit A